ncbi:hypothetical protein BDAP_000567 [Binucleata daphniae]
MDELLNKKSSLQSKLNSFEDSNEAKKLEKEIKNLEKQKYEKQIILGQKIDKLNILQKKITEYKKNNAKKYEKEVIKTYEKIIKNVNHINFEEKECFEVNYNKMKKYDKKSKIFGNLNQKIKDCMKNKRNEHRKEIIDDLQKNMDKNSPIHLLSINVNSIIEYERITGENVFAMFMVSKVCESVMYHFLSNKETNRLDKPEWFFDYFLGALRENRKLITLYENLYEAENDCIGVRKQTHTEQDNRKEDDTSSKNVYGLIFERMGDLICARFNEIVKSESKQKINLMLHFCDELKIFKKIIKSEFDKEIDTRKVCESLLKIVKENVNDRMEEIHLGNYKKWFIEYKEMLKNTFNVYLSLYELDNTLFFVVCQHIIDNIYIYCELFINQMRYLSREEIHLLCLIFSEIENIKVYVIEQENEHDLMTLSEKQINIQKLSKFNGDNMKLIKSLGKNDVNNILKRIRNIKYVPQKTLIDFNIDLRQILNEYKKYLEKGYNIFEKCIAEQIDDFLVQNIILKNMFSSDEYFEFKEFYKKVYKNFTTYKNWKTITACKCIEDIFNGRVPGKEDDSLFSLIYKNYENE